MKFTASSILALLPLASAHFEILDPKPRPQSETLADNFPCGGSNDVSTTRAAFNPNGGTIQISLGHTTTNVEVLFAQGNNPGSAFNTVVRRTFLATGLGDFCIDSLTFPNVTQGTNGTIQIQSDGHNGGGLYGCIDVTLTNTGIGSKCPVNNKVQVGAAEVSGHANGTAYGASGSGSGSGSTPSGTSSGAGPSKTGAAPAGSSSAPPSAAGIVSVGVSSLVLAVVGALAMNL